MKTINRSILLLLTIFLSRSLLAMPSLVQAQTPPPPLLPKPGHYLGFVSFILHSDYPITSEGGNTTNYIDYEGLWMVNESRIELDIDYPINKSTISATDLKPVKVIMDYTQAATIKDPFADCILGATIDGLARFRLAGGNFTLGLNKFRSPLDLKSNTTTSFEKFKAFGSLPGCDKQTLSDSIWGSMEGIVKFNSGKVGELELAIGETGLDLDVDNPSYSTSGRIDGKCQVVLWKDDESTSRDTPKCTWVAYKADRSWRKAVKK